MTPRSPTGAVSLSVDDEGTPGECTVLIEHGVLRNHMQDKRTPG